VKVLVCIDDTDNLETIGTGKLSQTMAEIIEDKQWGSCSAVSRHQLFVHDDIPYTSHNSSMCFGIDFTGDLAGLIDFGAGFLEERSAEGSDPGFCVVPLDNGVDRDALMDFGRRAKCEVLSKALAYDLAKDLGVHLSEHGGTGDGVVGAIAGIGLRLSGNDGRFRGWVHFGPTGTMTTVETLCTEGYIDGVKTVDGELLAPDTGIWLAAEKVKTMFSNNQRVVMVTRTDGEQGADKAQWRTLTKPEIRQY
jgi:hypothetical protein